MKFDHIKDLENKIPKKGSFKHMLRRMDEDGRIVKGVNTTPDVDVNQIPKEAGKFGNKVDKDGRPPTLSTKVRGKSTNVLFNLGLNDSYNNESTDLDSLRKFVKSQREAPDQVLYQMMMAPDTYGHSASNFVRSWYEKTKEENGLNDVDSALEIMVDQLGMNENFAEGKSPHKKGTKKYKKHIKRLL